MCEVTLNVWQVYAKGAIEAEIAWLNKIRCRSFFYVCNYKESVQGVRKIRGIFNKIALTRDKRETTTRRRCRREHPLVLRCQSPEIQIKYRN